MILLISYDLNKYERPSSYTKVEKMIRESVGGTKCIKALYSQWLVDTTNTPETWHERMEKVTDDNDGWLIVKIYPGDYSGRLNIEAVDWLRAKA